jgi:predicted MFS family arabinose efflux permease
MRLPFLQGPIGLAIVFTACNAVTHGFSIFLYSALLPDIRENFSLSYSQAALIAALLQIFYMGASLLSGLASAWISPLNMIRLTMLVSPLLLGLAVATPWVMPFALCLALVSACAVSNWNGIAALTADVIAPTHRSRVLGLASSGAAFAICLNGVLIAWLRGVSLIQFWLLCSLITAVVSALTFWMLAPLARKTSMQVHDAPSLRGVTRQWMRLWNQQPAARHIVLLSALIGSVSGPFLNFLSAFVTDALGAGATATGSLWTLIGVSGVTGGVVIGSLADRYGALRVMALSIAAFGLGMLVLIVCPGLAPSWLAAGLFALFYFPIWGLMAAWLSARLSSLHSLQIVSLSMVGYGLAGASANAVCGLILQATGDFRFIHLWIVTGVLASLRLLSAMAKRNRMQSVLAG